MAKEGKKKRRQGQSASLRSRQLYKDDISASVDLDRQVSVKVV